MLKLIIGWVLFFPVSLLTLFCEKDKIKYYDRITIKLDCFANKEFRALWNKTLINPEGYKFGRRKETISSVLGKNYLTKTLTRKGLILYRILNTLENNHCEKSINNNIKPKKRPPTL